MILFNKYKERSMYPINPYSHKPQILRDGLVVQLEGEKYIGGTSWPLSGSANTAGVVGGPEFGNKIVTFDGVNDYVYISGQLGASLGYTSGPFTHTLWINLTSFTTNVSGQSPQIIFKGQFNSSGYYCSISTNGTVGFRTCQNGSTQITYSKSLIQLNVWNEITIVRQGSSVRIYINGYDATNIAANHIDPTYIGETFSLMRYGGSAPIYTKGKLGYYSNYNRALSPLEVLHNHNATKDRYLQY